MRRRTRWLVICALGLPPVALALLVALVLTWGPGQQARAENTSGVNFSLSSTGCDSSIGPTTCTLSADSQFTVAFNLVSLGSVAGFAGYDVTITWGGNVNYVLGSLKQQGTGVWSGVNGCGFPVGEAVLVGGTPTPVGTKTVIPSGSISTVCAQGTSATGDSNYTGALMTMRFDCKSGPGTITLILGDTTDLTDGGVHTEAAASEALTVNCGAAGTPTPCPTSGCPTPTITRTPTNTVVHPTNTPTNTPPQMPRPDLVITSIDVFPPKPEVGEFVDIVISVSNPGGGIAGAFSLDLYYEGPPAPGENGGSCRFQFMLGWGSGSCTWRALGPFSSSFDLWAQVDTHNEVDESNEGNNIFGPQRLNINEPVLPTNTPRPPTNTPVLPTTTPRPPTNTPVPPAPTGTPTPTPWPRNGDANKDGATNAIDAALVLQYSAGLLPSINPSSDVNGDGGTNAIDAAIILQYAAGLTHSIGPAPTLTPTPAQPTPLLTATPHQACTYSGPYTFSGSLPSTSLSTSTFCLTAQRANLNGILPPTTSPFWVPPSMTSLLTT